MMSFETRIDTYRDRVEQTLEAALPFADTKPARLHQAMRYAVLGGGKRVRPLLCYAASEALELEPEVADPMAAAVEFIHAFSLVHDDLPAMDDDDLRRGKPTVHKAFDEALAILVGDALQSLAFELLSQGSELSTNPRGQCAVVCELARACGSLGMTGGQAIDLQSEGKQLDVKALEDMHERKTGRLIHAAIVMPVRFAQPDQEVADALDRFGSQIGLCFQIKDDLLDVEGNTEQIGKMAGMDSAHDKATYPLLLGLEQAHQRADQLAAEALEALAPVSHADGLRSLANLILERSH